MGETRFKKNRNETKMVKLNSFGLPGHCWKNRWGGIFGGLRFFQSQDENSSGGTLSTFKFLVKFGSPTFFRIVHFGFGVDDVFCFYAKCDVFGVQVVVSKLLFLFIPKFREDSKAFLKKI